MRRTTITALVVAVASAAALAPPVVAAPPAPVAPGPGANVPAGSAVTFQVQGEDGDSGLSVRVSASSQTGPDGRIDDDADSVSLAPTSAGSTTFEGTAGASPLYDHWANRAGLYYWQPYRNFPSAVGQTREIFITGTRPVEIGPQPLEPADGAVLPTASRMSFRASTLLGGSDQYLWVHVSRSGNKDATGLIGEDAEIEALQPTADPSVWFADPTWYSHSTFWMNTPGTYFWQPYRISSFGDPDGWVEGPVRSFTLTGSAAAPPPPATTRPPATTTPTTIRGSQAFTRGTANDLYLACTTLDVYLIDVLPAESGGVWVTGAADLRLKGRTVSILLDGRRVGTAVVGSTGAFQATVRAPSRAKRSTARYQARVGTSASQRLKLQRRMVAARLTRRGGTFTFTGRISKPFAARPATVQVQRYLGCGRVGTFSTTVRPSRRTGRFTLRFAVPDASVKALMYRARTKVATRKGGAATYQTYTLPRAIDIG